MKDKIAVVTPFRKCAGHRDKKKKHAHLQIAVRFEDQTMDTLRRRAASRQMPVAALVRELVNSSL